MMRLYSFRRKWRLPPVGGGDLYGRDRLNCLEDRLTAAAKGSNATGLLMNY